jgi:hypothetical protein
MANAGSIHVSRRVAISGGGLPVRRQRMGPRAFAPRFRPELGPELGVAAPGALVRHLVHLVHLVQGGDVCRRVMSGSGVTSGATWRSPETASRAAARGADALPAPSALVARPVSGARTASNVHHSAGPASRATPSQATRERRRGRGTDDNAIPKLGGEATSSARGTGVDSDTSAAAARPARSSASFSARRSAQSSATSAAKAAPGGAAPIASSAFANSSAVWKRRSGSRERALLTTSSTAFGTSARSRLGRGTGFSTSACNRSPRSSPGS